MGALGGHENVNPHSRLDNSPENAANSLAFEDDIDTMDGTTEILFWLTLEMVATTQTLFLQALHAPRRHCHYCRYNRSHLPKQRNSVPYSEFPKVGGDYSCLDVPDDNTISWRS